MDEESQDSGFDSDSEMGLFLDVVTEEENAEAYGEEVLP